MTPFGLHILPMIFLLLPLIPSSAYPKTIISLPLSSRQSAPNSNSPTPQINLTAVQRNGIARLSFQSELPIISSSNETINITALLPSNAIPTTTVFFSEPQVTNSSNRWTIPTTILFAGPVGIINFTINALTFPSRIMYRANFRVIIIGISVAVQNSILSAPDAPAYALTSFENWLQVSQLALPIRVQLPPGRRNVLAQFRLQVLSLEEDSTNAIVDAVTFDPVRCKLSQPLVVSLPNQTTEENLNTVFVLANNSQRLGFAQLSPQCGVGLTSDFSWLIIRLEPYRVANYGFVVQITWLGLSDSTNDRDDFGNDNRFVNDPVSTLVKFRFDKNFVPPPIVRNYSRVLDPFGGELLRIPVENTLVPPQLAALNISDFALNLTTSDGTSQILDAVDIITSSSKSREIMFNTPAWTKQSEGTVFSTLLYRPSTKVIEDDVVGESNEAEPFSKAVVQPGESFGFSLASNKLASLSTCDQDPEIYERDNFLLFTLRLNQYTPQTFSEYKNNLIKSHIAQRFPVLKQDAFRLVSIEKQLVQYAILIVRFGDTEAVLSQAETLRRSITDGTLASQINSKPDNIGIEKLRIVNGTLCVLYPLLEINVEGRLEGQMTRLIPLWIFLGFSIMFFFFVCCVSCLRYLLSVEQRKHGSYSDDESVTPSIEMNDGSFNGKTGKKLQDLIPVETNSSVLQSTDDEGESMESPIRYVKRLFSRLLSRSPLSGSETGMDFIMPNDGRNSISPTVYVQTITEQSQ